MGSRKEKKSADTTYSSFSPLLHEGLRSDSGGNRTRLETVKFPPNNWKPNCYNWPKSGGSRWVWWKIRTASIPAFKWLGVVALVELQRISLHCIESSLLCWHCCYYNKKISATEQSKLTDHARLSRSPNPRPAVDVDRWCWSPGDSCTPSAKRREGGVKEVRGWVSPNCWKSI